MPKSKLSHELIPEKITDWQNEVLKSISYAGSAEAKEKAIIGDQSNNKNILDLSNGQARISRTCLKKSELILFQPSALAGFDRREIKCCLCHHQVSYPTWYYKLEFAINQFHYFICFDSEKPGKPTTKCYRRI
jgi:hypothetical protein